MQQKEISIREIEEAQKSWADNIIKIGKRAREKKSYRDQTADFIHSHYAYDYEDGTVLFKPTKAQAHPFRKTFKSALSYFIGGDIEFAEDNEFALLPWSTIVFKNHGFYHHHDIATVMGQYDFFDIDQNITSVEYTFGYVRAKNKQLKIFLHHSSLPYNGGLEKSDKV